MGREGSRPPGAAAVADHPGGERLGSAPRARHLMQAPERIAVPTCVGCGAMGRFGTCEAGCSEQKLELVRATAHDELLQAATETQARIGALEDVLRGIAEAEPGSPEAERAYRSAQRAARDALLADRRAEPAADHDPAVEHATVWWCAACGGIDAPQPCIGICVWRPVEWVSRGDHMRLRERLLGQRQRHRQIRDLLRRIAHVTPREGHWQQGWRLVRGEARELLADAQPARGVEPSRGTPPVGR